MSRPVGGPGRSGPGPESGSSGEEPPSGEILHIATPAQWAEAQRTGSVAPASLATEGFVHCSTRGQLAATLARHFAGAGPLVGLVLDAAAIATDLRWEESHPGEWFPHVYAPIAVSAVVAVEPLTPAGG